MHVISEDGQVGEFEMVHPTNLFPEQTLLTGNYYELK